MAWGEERSTLEISGVVHVSLVNIASRRPATLTREMWFKPTVGNDTFRGLGCGVQGVGSGVQGFRVLGFRFQLGFRQGSASVSGFLTDDKSFLDPRRLQRMTQI